MPLDACTLTPHTGRANLPTRAHDHRGRGYLGPMPNQPEPEIIDAAGEIDIDPQALRDFLDAGRHRHADAAAPDDGPGITAELNRLRADPGRS